MIQDVLFKPLTVSGQRLQNHKQAVRPERKCIVKGFTPSEEQLPPTHDEPIYLFIGCVMQTWTLVRMGPDWCKLVQRDSSPDATEEFAASSRPWLCYMNISFYFKTQKAPYGNNCQLTTL